MSRTRTRTETDLIYYFIADVKIARGTEKSFAAEKHVLPTELFWRIGRKTSRSKNFANFLRGIITHPKELFVKFVSFYV